MFFMTMLLRTLTSNRAFKFAFLIMMTAPSSMTLATPDSTRNTKNTSFAQGLFTAGNWCRPFWADMHSTITKAEYAFAANNPEYDWGLLVDEHDYARSRPFVFANVGIDVPVWSGFIANGKIGVSATLPYLVDVWLDMFERTTAPVINTAYRFGLPEFNFIYNFVKPKYGINNISLKLILFKHECSHIGDDITFIRSRNKIMALSSIAQLTKLNISYNYWQVEATLNDPVFSTKRCHSLRAAFLMVYNNAVHWYEVTIGDDPSGSTLAYIAPAMRRYEFWAQYQWQSDVSRSQLQCLASVELRGRIRYHYPYLSADEHWQNAAEHIYPCLNAMLGVRYRNPKMLNHSVGAALRAYYGVNPYGQFRSIPQYWQVGAALVVE
jgi:hypothetical protein